MKRLIGLILFVMFVFSTAVMAQPIAGGGIYGGGSGKGVLLSADCDTAAYYSLGTLCQDTDDGKLYKGTGAGVTEIAAGGNATISDAAFGAGWDTVADVAPSKNAVYDEVLKKAASAANAQTWGSGAAASVDWTFNVSGTDTTLKFGSASLLAPITWDIGQTLPEAGKARQRLTFGTQTVNGDADSLLFIGYNYGAEVAAHPALYMGLEGYYNDATKVWSEWYLEGKGATDAGLHRPITVGLYNGVSEITNRSTIFNISDYGATLNYGVFNGDTQSLTLTNNQAGGVPLTLSRTHVNPSGGALIDLKYTADGDAQGLFMRGYDNAGGDLKFSIAADGAATFGTVSATTFTGALTGNASGTAGGLSGTPNITVGAVTATTVNKLTLTQPANGSTLTIADGKTLTASNTLRLAGTDSTVITFPAASGTVGYTGTMGTTGKLCVSDGGTPPLIVCNTDTPAGLGTIQAVGNITTGPAFTAAVPGASLTWNNATSGTIILTAQTGALGVDTAVSLPAAAGTLIVGPANVPITIAGPNAARTYTLPNNDFTMTIPAGKTLALGGSLTTSGAYDTTLTMTAGTAITLPTTGTLAILGANTFTADQTISTHNLVTDTSTGSKIGTATNQKLGFFNSTPVVQQTGDLVTGLSNLGLIASGTVALSTSATNAVNSGITNDTTTNAAMYPVWVTANTGNLPLKTASTKLSFNPSTGLLTSTGFSGPLTGAVTGNVTGDVTGNVSGSSGSTTGNAATATTLANGDKGDITASSGTITIDAGVVTLAKMADMATASLIGRSTAATGVPEVLSASTARTLLGLGTVYQYNVGTSANNVVQLDGSAKLPAIDGSALTNLPVAGGAVAAAGTTALTGNWDATNNGANAFTITAGGFTAKKVDGTAGKTRMYEANSTGLDTAGFRGPASLTDNTSYEGQFPNARPASGTKNVLTWNSTATGGNGTPATPYYHPMTFVDLDASYLALAGGTATGKIITATNGTAAGLNLTQSADHPSSQVNGDLWITAGGLYARVAGGQVGPFSTGAPAFSAITAATNTNALVIGTSGSLTTSGTGTITATGVGTLGQNLIFTDATYDIGATGATRPRDAFLSRSLNVQAATNQLVLGATPNFTTLHFPASSGAVTVTMPNATSTVTTNLSKLSVFAATTSAELAGVLSDENASGGFMTNPMSAAGDMIYGGVSGATTRLVVAGQPGYIMTSGTTAGGTVPVWLAPGAAGKVFRGAGTTTTPTWSTATFADTYAKGTLLHASGTDAVTGLAAGATTEILVGGGSGELPIWTTATGTGAPARAGSPTFTTKITTPLIDLGAGISLTGGAGIVTFTDLAGTTEDLSLNLRTANTAKWTTGSAVDKMDFGAINLVTTGTIQGGMKVDDDANGKDAAAMTAIGVHGTLFIASGTGTWILPTAVGGESLCLMSSGAAADLILDTTAGDKLTLKGTEGGDGKGATNAAAKAAGDFICVVGIAANKWSSVGMGGAWVAQP